MENNKIEYGENGNLIYYKDSNGNEEYYWYYYDKKTTWLSFFYDM